MMIKIVYDFFDRLFQQVLVGKQVFPFICGLWTPGPPSYAPAMKSKRKKPLGNLRVLQNKESIRRLISRSQTNNGGNPNKIRNGYMILLTISFNKYLWTEQLFRFTCIFVVVLTVYFLFTFF